ncbi:Wzz/FepE/Etk N-terminal domain-containing protein [Flavimaricola marinus]|uniref:Tyrosine kinase n=1 Tax=Flavimaricola marinus TaxID=1819565 RepID=A0A238L9D4_9RHOB|nr:Wzz/FepE/Etk N-terminal domain-containing protein [Flavimaricola marinus]SMY06278.1 tyrosine kinase [Flavimaricola marinus]
MNNAQPDRSAAMRAAVPAASDDELDLIGLLRTVWRGKWFIALCMVIAMAIGGWQTFKVAVPLYSSTATMVLRINPLDVFSVESVLSGFSGDEIGMNTEMEVIRSRELIGRAVEQLDLVNDPEFNPMLRDAPVFSPINIIGGVVDLVFGSEEKLPPTEQQIFDRVVTNVREAVSAEIEEYSYIFCAPHRTSTSRPRWRPPTMAS